MDIQTYLTQQNEQGRWNGSALVRRADKTLLDAAYGYAEHETARPNTPETAFQIASVSKQFAATAILLLHEQGRLSPADAICQWLPTCPDAWQTITIHHLLTHTSGIGHWQDFPMLDLYQPMQRGDLLALFQQAPLKFAPGSDWSYSSPGYVLLAHIVEQITNDSYAHFLEQSIFQPLGMDSTVAGNVAGHPAQAAVGYAGEKRLPSFNLDAVSIGAGDVWSTTHDLARWLAALTTPGMLLNAASLQMMFSPFAAITSRFGEIADAHYGYGWVIATMNGQPMYYHPGDNAGFAALVIMLPASDTHLILLTNDEDVDLWKLSQRLLGEMSRGS